MPEQPSSGRQKRAAIPGQLLRLGGVFRPPPLAKGVHLSQASPSRILFDLKTSVVAYTTFQRERSPVSESGAVRHAGRSRGGCLWNERRGLCASNV
jgi:hypothetical protein